MDIDTDVQTNDVDDLMALFGFEKYKKYSRFTAIRLDAENAWLEGKDADTNPHKTQSLEYWTWNETWKVCNKHC